MTKILKQKISVKDFVVKQNIFDRVNRRKILLSSHTTILNLFLYFNFNNIYVGNFYLYYIRL